MYLYFKAFHIIFVITWMAGLFYLPRLFVYHVETGHEIFKVMEKKLLYIIIIPSSIVVFFAGTVLAFLQHSWTKPYFHVKFTCALGLLLFQYVLSRYRLQLLHGVCTKTSTFFRLLNEVPSVLLIIIVFCLVFKPFS